MDDEFDVIHRSLMRHPDVRLSDERIQLQVDGEWLAFTNHCFDRFEERLNPDRFSELWPHLDHEKFYHRLCAIVTLFNEGELGVTQNKKHERIFGCRSGRWFFVIRRKAIVTCYNDFKGNFKPLEDEAPSRSPKQLRG